MIGLNPPRWILFSSLILAACGVSNSQRLQPLASASSEGALPPDLWPSGLPEVVGLAPMSARSADQVQPVRSGRGLAPEPTRAHRRDMVLASPTSAPEPLPSLTAAEVAAALVAQAEAPLVSAPLVVSLPAYTLSRTLPRRGLFSSLPSRRPAMPIMPAEPTSVPAILPALPPRLRSRRVYVGTINRQEQADSNLVLALDDRCDWLYGRYELPLSERATAWVGFEFTAAVNGLAFAGEGVFLSEGDGHEVVAMTVTGELSADRQQVTGQYEVVGESQLQGTFTAQQYAFADHEDWHDEAEASALAEVVEPMAGTVLSEWTAEAEVAADTDTGRHADHDQGDLAPTPEAPVTIITLPPPELSAYRDMDFLFAFPPVLGRFESDVYRFGGFEQAKVVGAHAWAATAQDDPNGLTYFMTSGHLVGSRYGPLLPWYRVQLLA